MKVLVFSLTICLTHMLISEIMFEKIGIYCKLVLCALKINGSKMSVDNVCIVIFISVCK